MELQLSIGAEGRELLMASKSGFYGIRMGYDRTFPAHMNGVADYLLSVFNSPNDVSPSEADSRAVSRSRDAVSRMWVGTGYAENIIYPSSMLLRREVIIEGDMRNRALIDGNYSVVIIGRDYIVEEINKFMGRKRKFPESIFIPPCKIALKRSNVACVYGTGHGMIILIKDGKQYADEIAEAHANGYLGLFNGNSHKLQINGFLPVHGAMLLLMNKLFLKSSCII